MALFSNKIIKIDEYRSGKKFQIKEIIQNLKNYPYSFIGDAFSFIMILIGIFVTAKYAYLIGHILGRAT